MSLFKKAATNIAVVDIRSSSIGAAYAVIPPGAKPRLVYSTRIPIDPHATEPLAEALPRALETVLAQLVREGSPLLRSASGSGRVDRVLVTCTAPWQCSEVFSKVIERDRPFVFTKELLMESMRKGTAAKGRRQVSNMIIATLLNGYEVEKPFGKRVNRAELILMSSSIDAEMMDMTTRQIRRALHQGRIDFNAFLPEVFMPMREVYPHQPDFLVLDIGGDAADILLVKHGLLISAACMDHGVNEMVRAARSAGISSPTVPAVDMTRADAVSGTALTTEDVWLGHVREALAEIAKHEPLPRTVLLLAEEHARDFLRALLDAPTLRSLWVSDESLAILPVLPTQFIPFLDGAEKEGADPALALLALAAVRRIS
ncbi:MAG: hypothetical protein ACM3TU_01220 [Bacillota bacterium]